MIYTIGFGSSDGEPIPEYNQRGEVIGYKKDQNGEVVLSKLDEATLQEIAATGGGRYFRAAADGSELAALTAELGLLQRDELFTQLEVRGIERFQIFLLVALVFMIAIEMIPDRVLNKIAARRAAMHERWSAAGNR